MLDRGGMRHMAIIVSLYRVGKLESPSERLV